MTTGGIGLSARGVGAVVWEWEEEGRTEGAPLGRSV